MATSNNDRISSRRLLDTLKGLQESRHLGSEPEVDPQTNEKTKHTIKQDYLPNADWNVNDPDADGYVQGRTHLVERTVGDIPVTAEQGMSTIPDMVKPEGFKTSTITWKPDYEAVAFEIDLYGTILTGYLLAEDENGDQITDPEIIISGTFYSGILVADYSAFFPDTVAVSAKYNGNDATCEYVIGGTEVIHKLPVKFYDKTDENALKNEIYDTINLKFVYKTHTFGSNYELIIIDDKTELEEFLSSNNYTREAISTTETYKWSKNINNETSVMYIKRHPSNKAMWFVVSRILESNFTWNFLYTTILQNTVTYSSTMSRREFEDKMYLCALNTETGNMILEDRLIFQNTDVKIVEGNEQKTVGNINSSLSVTITNNNWVFFEFPSFFKSTAEVTILYYNNEKMNYHNLDNMNSVTNQIGLTFTEFNINNTVIKRSYSYKQFSDYTETTMSAGQTYSETMSSWKQGFNIDTAILDEIVNVKCTKTFQEEQPSGSYITRELECWVDENYTFNIKNTSNAQINVPKGFTFYFSWTPSILHKKGIWYSSNHYYAHM